MDSSLWEDNSISENLKYEKNLNFTAVPTSEDDEYGYSKKKLPRDPLSHRIIEKRRRDRMNNCLSDLSRLIPNEYMKKGRGRIEKTEIIEMAIRHMKHLQAHPCTEGSCCPLIAGMTRSDQDRNRDQDRIIGNHVDSSRTKQDHQFQMETKEDSSENYRLGFNECLSETMHFLVEVEGFFSSDSLCLQLTSHLRKHCDNILKGKAFIAQLSAVSHNKRRLTEPDDVTVTEGKPVTNGQSYNNGCYHSIQPDSSRNGHQNLEQNGCNGTGNTAVTPYQSHRVFPADSSSNAIHPTYKSYQHVPRTISFSQQLSPTLSCPGSDRGLDTVGSYKFKEDIRKRFCKEAGAVIPISSNGSGMPTRKIPVFALSPHGSYYIPLTLELPYIDEGDFLIGEPAILHPVTISVCFPSQQNHKNHHQNYHPDSGQ